MSYKPYMHYTWEKKLLISKYALEQNPELCWDKCNWDYVLTTFPSFRELYSWLIIWYIVCRIIVSFLITLWFYLIYKHKKDKNSLRKALKRSRIRRIIILILPIIILWIFYLLWIFDIFNYFRVFEEFRALYRFF